MTAFYGDDETYLNYFADKNPLAFHGYSSFDTMIEAIERFDRSGIPSGHDRASGWSRGQERFHGTVTIPEAFKLAKDGWQEGAELADEVRQLISTEHAKAPKRINKMVGNSVIVPRMLSGNPVHMRAKAKRDKIRIVTVFVNCAMLASVSQKVSNLKASVICGLIDLLERSGYSCEIIVITTSNALNGKPGFQSATILKNAGEKLNIENCVFALGHAAFFRRFCFSLIGMSPECKPIWAYMGVTASSFDTSNPTKKNEIYIDRITPSLSEKILRTEKLSEQVHIMIDTLTNIKVEHA